MTVRPIDLQIMMPRTVEVSKTQQYLKENNDTQKNLMTVQFQEQLQTAKQKVNKRSKTEKALIEQEHGKSKKDKNGNKKKNKKQKQKQKQKNNHITKKHNRHIDIKI
ncbi:MAG: hypothetical protein PHE70_02420 [Tepidanaerobacteraceae bacterium]|nr:hypothetical protein [Tepidanaerobacteraceae bacterium]